jgi:hypothetical protein
LRAMLGIFAEDFRLPHAVLPGGKFRTCFNPQLIPGVPPEARPFAKKFFHAHG